MDYSVYKQGLLSCWYVKEFFRFFLVRCQTKVHNCKYSYYYPNITLGTTFCFKYKSDDSKVEFVQDVSINKIH